MVNQTHFCSGALLPAHPGACRLYNACPQAALLLREQETGGNSNLVTEEGTVYKGVGAGQRTSLDRGHQGQHHLVYSFYPVPRGCVTCPRSHSKRQSHQKTRCPDYQSVFFPLGLLWLSKMKQNKNTPGYLNSNHESRKVVFFFLTSLLEYNCFTVVC